MKLLRGSTLTPSIADDANLYVTASGTSVEGDVFEMSHEAAADVSIKRRSWVLFAIVAMAALALILRRAARERDRKRDGPNDAREAIARGNAAYLDALERADAIAYADLFAEDAVSMPASGAMIRGRNAIEASIGQAFTRVRFRNGSLETAETRIEGTTAYESGTYTFDVVSDGVPMVLEGRYLVVWRKTGDEWKIALDSSQPGVPS